MFSLEKIENTASGNQMTRTPRHLAPQIAERQNAKFVSSTHQQRKMDISA
jgi:hypothetical protein